jgi:signal transduction histidine kinase
LRDRRGLLRGRAADGPVQWRDDRSVGALQRRVDGTYAGFVVHRGAIDRAMGAGWPALPAGMRASLVLGSAPTVGASVRLLEGETRLLLSWSSDGVVAAKTRESLIILLGVVAAAVLIALGLAAMLLGRMRSERRLSALRTDFVAAVSHELRTPIASLRMLSELLAEERVEPDERPEIYGALAREARRLGNTVHRLLTFSRMEGGRARAQLAERSVTAAVSDAVATFGDRHPDVQLRGPDLDREVVACFDEAQLTMALDNLLQNAHKYASEGQPYEVTVTEDDTEVRVAVRDRGAGIAARDQERIFAPFERADDRLSEATEGSGIGLALVRHVAKTHGGRAWVDSELGRGATFSITWPRSQS